MGAQEEAATTKVTFTICHDMGAHRWYVHASDVPGLHAEAPTLGGLAAIIADVLPDLIGANGILKDAGLPKAF